MGGFDDIRKLKELLDTNLITQAEFDKQKKLILDSLIIEKNDIEEYSINSYNQIDEEKRHNKISIIVVGSLFVIFLFSILISVRHDQIISAKKEFATEITNETDYKVRYRPTKKTFEYVAKEGTDWQSILESNTEQYEEYDSVKTSFIRIWRNNVIPSIKIRSHNKLVKNSKIEIVDSRDGKTKLLEIMNGDVIYDKFSDIEEWFKLKECIYYK